MKSEHHALRQFVAHWIAEFKLALEMFTGEAPEIRSKPVETVFLDDAASTLWIRQIVAAGDSFETWVGAAQPAWSTLGGALGETTEEIRRSTFLEIVNQAQQGALTLFNSEFGGTLASQPVETAVSPSIDPAAFALFEVEFVNAGYPSLLVAIENRALPILALLKPQELPSEEAGPREDTASLILSNLLNVRMPVSVSVGMAELEFRRVLTAGPGSVFTLNKDSEELLELLVHGKVVARGDIVVAKGHYGFRVRQIVSRHDRLKMCSSSQE